MINDNLIFFLHFVVQSENTYIKNDVIIWQ